MRFRLIGTIIFVVISMFSCVSLAQETISGRWLDGAPGGDPIGRLVIADNIIIVGHKVTYQVKSVGHFGDGKLFIVTGLDRRKDPEGCGSSGKVHYIAVQPLPAITPGVVSPAIRIFFYSGDKAPTPDSIQNDVALCSIHPFVR